MQINIAEFFGLVIVGMFIYGVMTFIFDKFGNYGIYRFIRERINVFLN